MSNTEKEKERPWMIQPTKPKPMFSTKRFRKYLGKYQWYLFMVAGFGWIADSGALSLVGNILYPVLAEYRFKPALLSLSIAIGFFIGVFVWGLSIDTWGRRYVFNITLLIGGTFGVAAGGANSFVALASLVAVLGMGVSGNIPVDSVILLDFLPGSHQYLLTAANAFWGVGLLLSNGIAWGLIPKHACSLTTSSLCTRSQNMGWRYYCFTTGRLYLLFWAVRLTMRLLESPRYLVGKGQNEEAVMIIHRLAKINGKTSNLTVEQLLLAERKNSSETSGLPEKRNLRFISAASRHLKGVFSTPKMARSTALLFMINLMSGISQALYFTFMPYIIATRGAKFGDGSLDTSYRNVGMEDTLLEYPSWVGNVYWFCLWATLGGIALLGTTIAKTSNQLLGWNVAYSFIGSIGYASMNAIGPERYHGQYRGTGTGLQALGNRLASIIGAPIALYADLTTAVPVYIAGALRICSGLLALLFPYEPRGHSSI